MHLKSAAISSLSKSNGSLGWAFYREVRQLNPSTQIGFIYTADLIVCELKKPKRMLSAMPVSNSKLHKTGVPAERLCEPRINDGFSHCFCQHKLYLAMQMNMAQLSISDIKISPIHCGGVPKLPMRRANDVRPGLNLE